VTVGFACTDDFEPRSLVCWRLRSWRELPPMGGSCAVVGSGKTGVANYMRGRERCGKVNGVGKWGARTCMAW